MKKTINEKMNMQNTFMLWKRLDDSETDMACGQPTLYYGLHLDGGEHR